MSRAREWYRWKRRSSTEFYLLWIVAIATYGIGDFVTTIILLSNTSLALESNPVVRWVLDVAGVSGFIGLKIGALMIGMSLSSRAVAHRDTVLYYLPPLGMSIAGLIATVLHLRVIL